MERDNTFIGQSGAFLDAVERASRAAPMRRPVLVIGERGTGKELIAERLHHAPQRDAMIRSGDHLDRITRRYHAVGDDAQVRAHPPRFLEPPRKVVVAHADAELVAR